MTFTNLVILLCRLRVVTKSEGAITEVDSSQVIKQSHKRTRKEVYIMNRFKKLTFFTDTSPPAITDEILRLEKQLSLALPDVHKEFLAVYNGANTNFGVLYGIDSIAEMYEANQLAKYVPGYVCIGGDNGNYEFIMEAKANAQAVYVVDVGALDLNDIRAGKVYRMAAIFDWLTSKDGQDPGDPIALFEEEEDLAFYTLVDIELLTFPSGGSGGLYKLLSDLGLPVSPKIVMDYQKTTLPCLIAKNKLLRELEPRLGDLKEPSVIRIVTSDL